MSHGRRFLCPTDLASPPWVLDPGEAHHARKVLRLKTGDRVTLMDGAGGTLEARLSFEPDGKVEASPIGEPLCAPPPPLRSHLLLGAPQAPHVDGIVEHAVELGVWKIVVASAARSPVRADLLRKRLPRWSQIALTAAKQSGNPHLPDIAVADGCVEAMAALPRRGWLLRQGAPPLPMSANNALRAGEFTLAVGPEGDFTDEEARLMEAAGLETASMACHTLRVETAALAALALLAHRTRALEFRNGNASAPTDR